MKPLPSMPLLLEEEQLQGLQHLETYQNFQVRANQIKNDLLPFLIDQKRSGKTVVGYGGAAKGNTLMNYAGLRPNLIPFVVDRNPAKQGKFMPGSRIPIVNEGYLKDAKPDYIVVYSCFTLEFKE